MAIQQQFGVGVAAPMVIQSRTVLSILKLKMRKSYSKEIMQKCTTTISNVSLTCTTQFTQKIHPLNWFVLPGGAPNRRTQKKSSKRWMAKRHIGIIMWEVMIQTQD